MLCPSCNQEMERETVRYHTPSGYERKLVVFECPYDCAGQDFTEADARIVALEARLEEAEAIIKPFAQAYKSQGDSSGNSTVVITNMAHMTIYQEWQNAAAWLKGGN